MTDLASRGGLRRGAEEAKKANDFVSSRPGYFRIKDGEQVFVQFVTEPWEWVTVDMHQQVPAKAKPDKFEGEWPKYVTPVCRHNAMADGMPMFEECYVCGHLTQKDKGGNVIPYKKSSRTWALAVIRKEKIENGKRGFVNQTREYAILDERGKSTQATWRGPELVVMTMAWTNFFQALNGSAQAYGGRIGNWVFSIKREGERLDTTYNIVGVMRVKQDFELPEYAEKLHITIDPENTDSEGHIFKTYPPDFDLERMIQQRAGDEYYGRYIDPRVTVKSGKKADVEKPDNEPPPEQIAKMQERILAMSSGKPVEASTEGSSEEPEETTTPASAGDDEEADFESEDEGPDYDEG